MGEYNEAVEVLERIWARYADVSGGAQVDESGKYRSRGARHDAFADQKYLHDPDGWAEPSPTKEQRAQRRLLAQNGNQGITINKPDPFTSPGKGVKVMSARQIKALQRAAANGRLREDAVAQDFDEVL